MRRLRGSLLLAALIGCGGGDSGSSGATQPPPSSNTPGPAASLTVQQGDGQSGEPGRALAVRPSVVVKDASGRLVPNAAVTFAVDSGGGSLADGNATSGTDGIATAGAWTLGAAEGKNVVVVSVTGVTPVRLRATAVIQPTDVASQTITASGGSIVVARPGSPVDGLRIDVPGGAFAGPVDLQLQYASSASIPHVDGVTLGSPLITLTSTATEAAKKPVMLRIPAKIADDEFPIVAVVDPAKGFVDALPTLSYDQNGITTMLAQFDETQYAEDPPAAGLIAPSAASQNPRVKVAIYLAKHSLLSTIVYNTNFAPGVDDWEFTSDGTPVFSATDAGQVVLARYYYRMRKSLTSGALWSKFEKARGAIGSDVAGYQWSAGIAKQFDGLVQPFVAAAVAARAANPIAYDRNTVQWVAASFVASGGAPQIMAFVNPAGLTYSPVLAYKWDGPSGIIYDANPRFPGDATRKSTWSSNGLSCTLYCVAVVGLNHLIGYASQLNAEYAQAVAGTINKSLFPQAFASASGTVIGGGGAPIDTLFMVDDTSRVWVECVSCVGQAPSTVQRQHGAAGVQSQFIYLDGGSAGWSQVPGGSGSNGFVIDLAKFPAPGGLHHADFRLGIEARAWNTAATGSSAGTGWLGWKTYQVTKFNASLTDAQPAPNAPVTITVATASGPALPPDGKYVFQWGDGTPSQSFTTRPASVQHQFPKAGTFQVVMEIRHPSNNALIGRATKSVTVKSAFLWRFTQFSAPLLTGYGLAQVPDQGGVANSDLIKWCSADSTFMKGLNTNPATGLLVQLVDTTIVNGTLYRPGLYLQNDPTGAPGKTANFDPTQTLVALARTSGQPYPDVYPPNLLSEPFADTLIVATGVVSGSAIAQIRDFTGLPATKIAAQTKRTLVAWDGIVNLNGSTASGTVHRTERYWAFLPQTSAKGMYYYGESCGGTITFTGTKVP
ncbi:MAG: Ig-like domain-containing protein [Gemmatimonadaceae bacterium]